MFIKPWNDEIEKILHRLVHDGKAYTKNTRIGTDFGVRFPEVIDADFLDVVTTNYRKKEKETIFVTKPGVVLIPKNKKFFFHKIF